MQSLFRRAFGFPIDLRVLSIVRILVAADLMWDWFIRWNIRELIYFGKGLDLDFPWYAWKFSFFHISDNPGFRTFLFGVILLSYFSLLIGYRTRWAAVVSFFGFISLASFNAELSTAEDSLGQMALFWLIVLPSGMHFSVDRLLGRSCRQGIVAPTRISSPWAWSIAFQFAVIYLCTGINKHLVQPNGWPSGTAIWGFVLSPHVGWGLGQLFMQLPGGVLRALCKVIPYQQLVMGILFFVPSRWTRLFAVLGGFALHLGIGTNMWTGDVWFLPICSLCLLIDPDFIDWAIARFRPGRGTGSAHSGAGALQVQSRFVLSSFFMLALVYCQILDIFDQNRKFEVHLPSWIRIPVIADVERAIFRGQHWAMYTSNVVDLTREVYVAESNQGPIDVTSAFEYPWMLSSVLEAPKIRMEYFISNRAPLLHRRIRDSIHARLTRKGCDTYDSYFEIYRRRFEDRFPGLKIQRVHIVFVQKRLPEVGDYASLSQRGDERWFRVNTWTPHGSPLEFDPSLASLLGPLRGSASE